MFRIATIEESLRNATDDNVWRRGQEYYRHGAVRDFAIAADAHYPLVHATAQVRGSDIYRSELSVEVESGEVTDASCSCPYTESNEYCKHIVALGLTLCARMQTLYGESAIFASADAIARALTVGNEHAPASLYTAQTTIPMTHVPFTEQYALVFHVEYERPQVFLFDTTRGTGSETAARLSRESVRLLLTDAAIVLTDAQRAFVTYLSKHDTWSSSFDMHVCCTLARDALIPLYRSTYEKKSRMHIGDTTTSLPVTIHYKRIVQQPDASSPVARPHTQFEIRIDIRNKRTWSTGREGLVYIQKNDIHMFSATAYTCALLKRILAQNFYYAPTHLSGMLTDLEVIHSNEILSDLARCFILKSSVTPEFVLTQHTKATPTLIVDYHASQSRLSIRGGVDYRCQVLDISREWHSTSWYSYPRPRRRTDAKAHPYIVSITDSHIDYATVDTKTEEGVYRALAEHQGFNKRATVLLTNNKKIEEFLATQWESLTQLGWNILYTHDEVRYETGAVDTDMAVDLDATRDWLAFDVTLYCGHDRVRLEDVVAFIERGDECLKTDDGRLIRVTNRAELVRLVRMIEHFSKNTATGTFEGRLYNAPELADVASNNPHYRTQFAQSFDAFMQEVRSGKPIEPVKLPSTHQKLLRPYQKSGVEWMHFLRGHRFGGILADEMGLGKTIQALSHIAIHATDGETSLIVCPKTLIHNWAHEARTRFPELSVAIVEGTAAERKRTILQSKNMPHLLITSYPLVQRDLSVYKALKKPFQYVVLDEAQSIKNPRTKNAHAVKAIPAEYRLALTGTPLENSVEELWSIFDFLMPGFLGAHATFQRQFGKPIMEDGDRDALAHLKSKTSCFMLRRVKHDVLKELPDKIETTMEVELHDDQNVLYQEVLARTKTDLAREVSTRGFKRSHIHILAALTRLRQICNHPSLLEHTGVYTSAKLTQCLDLVRELRAEGRKVLIFSQFTSMLDIIARSFDTEGITYSLLTGKTNNRQTLVDAFNADPSITAFLISLKAGGTGLNLTSADTVIIFDPWWNPAVENQAVDRAHRIGQKKTVNVYRLVTIGTIEEKMLILKEKKATLFDALVQESGDLFKKLTWDDVQDLLR
jgi:superfamily II DNA or RNA helicase